MRKDEGRRMEDESLEMELPRGEILVYRTDDGQIRIETRMQNETIWLTINQMAKLFGVDKSGISRHLKNIFQTGELQREATVAKFATVQNEGGRSVSRDAEKHFIEAEKEFKQIESQKENEPLKSDENKGGMA